MGPLVLTPHDRMGLALGTAQGLLGRNTDGALRSTRVIREAPKTAPMGYYVLLPWVCKHMEDNL